MANQTNTIPKGWKKTTLGEVVNFSQGLQISTDDQSVKKKEGYIRFVRIVDYTNEGEIPRYIKNPGRCFVNKDDLVMIRYGSQTAGKIMRGISGVIANNTFKITPNESLDNKWLYWFLRQDSIYQYLNKDQSSSTMPAITFTQVGNIEIPILSLPEQRAIAAVLSSFDDKIELLREQNKTLEATAQAIFKEWFVKFNFPGATGKMIDSELGKISEGWRVRRLEDEFDITIGRTPPRLETQWFSKNSNGKKWISIKDIVNSEVYISNTSEYLTYEAIEKFNIPVIPENTAVLSFKMTVGKLAITTEEMLSNEAIAHLKINNNSHLSTEYIYLFLKGLDFNSLGSTSSIVTAINSTMIKMLHVLIPEAKTMKSFNALIQPIFAKLKNNNSQIQTLSKLRDTLLPKLMKGEVRVKGFDK